MTPAHRRLEARVLARREVLDRTTGEVWAVSELDAAALPAARGPRCLLFDGQRAVRRVWAYPPDWERLADTELLALSWGV
jgi:hypothetical protein